MTIFADRIHRFFKRLARWYLDEQPTPRLPDRYEQILTEYANEYPYATRAQWKHFSLLVAAQAFGDGYQVRVDEEEPIEDMDRPDRVANQLDRNWRDKPIDLINPDVVVPEVEPPEAVITEDQLRRMSR